MDLVAFIKNRKDNESIFSMECIIGWYDDITSGILKLKGTEEFYFVNLCYFAPTSNERIVSLISISLEWGRMLKNRIRLNKTGVLTNVEEMNKEIDKYYREYSGTAYLLRTDGVSGEHQYLNIPEISSQDIIYFPNVDDVLNQSDQLKGKWKSYF